MPSTTPTNAGPLSTVAAWLDAFFRGQGFSGNNLKAADAAFLGNFTVESGVSPTSYNAAENAHGLANWEGGRWTALQSYAAAHGLSPTSMAADLGYLGQELTGSYSGVVANLRGVTNPGQAAQIVQSQFEGSTVASLPQRQADASAIYNWLGGQQGGISGLIPSSIPVPGGGSGSASGAPTLPYALGSLTGNLTGAQRTGIINYLEAVGNTPAAIGYWLRDNVAGAFGHTGSLGTGKLGAALNAGNLGVYESSGAQGDIYDQALEQAYNAIGAGGGIGYGAGHLGYSWTPPGSGLIKDAENAAEQVVGWIAAPIVRFLIAAALVIAGGIAVYLAVKMLAAGGDEDTGGGALPTSASGEDKEAETPKSSEGGGEAAAAEDAGEVAAA